MSRASASADDSFKVEAFTIVFQKLGISIPESLVRMALEEEKSGEPRGYGRTPAWALLRHFAGSHSRWPRFLRGTPWAAQALIGLLEMAAVQAGYQFASPLTAAQSYCLTIRRWMGAIAKNPDYADIDVITDVIRREKLLPQARGFPEDEAITMTPQWHEQCARAMERLSDGRPISRLKDKAPEFSRTDPDTLVFRIGKGKFSKGRPAKDLTDPFWIITQSVWQTVENSIEIQTPLSQDEARASLIVLFQCLFGIAEDDVQSIRINENGGPISIHPKEQKAILHIGSGFYPTGRCFRRSDLALPLPGEIAWLLKSSHPTGHGRLLDLWTSTGWRKAKEIVRAKVQTSRYATGPMDWSAHRIHREVAIMHLKQSVAEVCLIEGRPSLGYRGPCSYLSIREDRAVQLFIDTYHHTRKLMGVPPRDLLAVSSNLTVFHGKQVESYHRLIDRLKSDVANSYSHNQIMACIERLMRLLGLRKSMLHVNPAQFARRFPERLLLITDKVVGESAYPHWLWLSPELWTLIDAVDEQLGPTQQLLPYLQEYRPLASDSLKDAAARIVHQIVHDWGFSRAARIAFRTALRELGAGDTVCDLAMGHAPVCGPLDYERPDSCLMMTQAVKHYLARLYEEYGINEIALTLAQKLAKYADPEACKAPLKSETARLERFSPRQDNQRSLPLWSKQEDEWFVQIWNALQNLETYPANEQTQRVLLLAFIAVEFGIPPSYLLRFASYYTLRNFLRSDLLQRSWFLATTGDCDKGALSSYPIVLGRGNAKQSAVWRFIQQTLRAPRGYKNGDRGCWRGIDWKLFAGVTENDLGRCVRKLLFGHATGAPMDSASAFELLEKCARVRSRHLHSGYVAGVFSEALPQVLNHFDVADVIRFREEVPDLCLLNGLPFEPTSGAEKRMPKNSPLSLKLEEIAWDATLNEQAKALKAWEQIRHLQDLVPSAGWIAKRFLTCRIPSDETPRLNSARASKIAQAVMREREKGHALTMSKPLRLPTPHEQARLHATIRQYLHECRPKIALLVRKPEDKEAFKKHVSGLASECLAMISCFGLRGTEAMRLLSERNGEHAPNVSVGCFGRSLWCVIRGTKTKNAKRVTRSFFCGTPDVVDELLASLATPRSTTLYGTKARIKNAAEKIGGSLHLFRHWTAIASVDRIFIDHYRTGNALLLLESFTRGLGHGCMSTTFQSYLGSFMSNSFVVD